MKSALEIIALARARGATITFSRDTGRLVISGSIAKELAAEIDARHEDIRSLFEEHETTVASDAVAAALKLVSTFRLGRHTPKSRGRKLPRTPATV
jgi:hypothetical protein